MNVQPDIELWGEMRQEFEGLRLKAYKDSGSVWTCGFGTTYLYDKARKVQEGDTITREDADRYMAYDSAEVIRQLNLYIKKPLNTAQSTAIADYFYNRGAGNFLKTELDELINANPNDPRILDEIRKTGLWDRLGNMMNGLVRRRKSEAFLYQTGLLRFKF